MSGQLDGGVSRRMDGQFDERADVAMDGGIV